MKTNHSLRLEVALIAALLSTGMSARGAWRFLPSKSASNLNIPLYEHVSGMFTGRYPGIHATGSVIYGANSQGISASSIVRLHVGASAGYFRADLSRGHSASDAILNILDAFTFDPQSLAAGAQPLRIAKWLYLGPRGNQDTISSKEIGIIATAVLARHGLERGTGIPTEDKIRTLVALLSEELTDIVLKNTFRYGGTRKEVMDRWVRLRAARSANPAAYDIAHDTVLEVPRTKLLHSAVVDLGSCIVTPYIGFHRRPMRVRFEGGDLVSALNNPGGLNQPIDIRLQTRWDASPDLIVVEAEAPAAVEPPPKSENPFRRYFP